MEPPKLNYAIKGGRVRKSHMEILNIQPPPDSVDEGIKSAYEDLVHPRQPLQQIEAVEKLACRAGDSEASTQVCTGLLVSTLLQLKPNVPLWTKILKSLPAIQAQHSSSYQQTTSSLICRALTSQDNPVALVQGVALLAESGDQLFSSLGATAENREEPGSCGMNKVGCTMKLDGINVENQEAIRKCGRRRVECIHKVDPVTIKISGMANTGRSCVNKVDLVPVTEEKMEINDRTDESCIKIADAIPVTKEKPVISDMAHCSCIKKVDGVTEDKTKICDMAHCSCIKKVDGVTEAKTEISDMAHCSCNNKSIRCESSRTLKELDPLVVQAVLTGLSQLWEKSLQESSAMETTTALQQIQQLVKSCTAYLQRHYKHTTVPTPILRLLQRVLVKVLVMLRHPTFPLDVRVNCGQLVAVLHRIQARGNAKLKHGRHQIMSYELGMCSSDVDEAKEYGVDQAKENESSVNEVKENENSVNEVKENENILDDSKPYDKTKVEDFEKTEERKCEHRENNYSQNEPRQTNDMRALVRALVDEEGQYSNLPTVAKLAIIHGVLCITPPTSLLTPQGHTLSPCVDGLGSYVDSLHPYTHNPRVSTLNSHITTHTSDIPTLTPHAPTLTTQVPIHTFSPQDPDISPNIPTPTPNAPTPCASPGTSTDTGTCLGVEILRAVLTRACQSSDGNVAVSTIRVVQQWTLRVLEALQSLLGSTKAPEMNNVNIKKDLCGLDAPQSLHGSRMESKASEIAKMSTKAECGKALYMNSPLIVTLVDYLWLAWDHFLDSVKHSTRDTFINFIKIQNIIDEDQSKVHCLRICNSFLQQLSSRKFRCSAVSCMVPSVGAQKLLVLHPTLPCDLLHLMKDPAMASHAAELLEALFTQHLGEVSTDDWQRMWLTPFIDLFSKDMQTFGFELLFKKLLFASPESLDTAVARLIQSSENPVSEKLCLLIMCVKIGRFSPQYLKRCKAKHSQSDGTLWKCLLPYQVIELCLSHCDESVQSAVFSLLCESPKSSELPEKQELDLIYDYFVHSLISQSPPIRQNLVKSTKKLFLRIKDGVLALVKSSNNKEKTIQMDIIIEEEAQFCRQIFALMLRNLECGSNFPRRGISLVILELFQDIIVVGCGKILKLCELTQDETYIDTLLFTLADSFENNKIVALKLLQSSGQLYGADHQGKLKCLISSIIGLASSCRPPDSMTAAYVLKYLSSQPLATQLIRESMANVEVSDDSYSREIMVRCVMIHLREEVKVAEDELLKAAASGPMYGLLLCLKMLLSDIPKPELTERHKCWVELVKEVLRVCFRVSELVAPVVRNSSPEGHLPMDLNPESLASLQRALQASLGNKQDDVSLSQDSGPDELVKAQAVSAQMLLLCAWRCVKEVSLILGNLVQEMPLSPSRNAVVSVSDVVSVGQYFLTQLLETKHRGAFEQSYVGLGRVCERLWQCQDDQLRRLPEKWLEEVMESIQDNGDMRLCATRRSAGVPFIVQAVLSFEPSVRGATCFKTTMSTLLTLAKESRYDGSEARIHAFNILRSVYRDTRLGDLVIPHVSEGVKAAIRSYKSTSWAERNAASLLFAALVTRMLGVKQAQDDLSQKNTMSALVFFRRYPELFEFLRGELDAGARGIQEGKLVPALFPTLLLIARLSPAPLEGRTTSAVSLAAFTPAILQCAYSSVFQLRTLASHALVPLVPPSHLMDIVNQLCLHASSAHQNILHGSLLCLSKLVKNYPESSASLDMNGVVNIILKISWTATEANPCLVTRSCALELFTYLSKHHIPKTSPELKSLSLDALSLIQKSDTSILGKPWATLCQKQAALFLLENPALESREKSLSECLMNSTSYEVQQCALENIMRLPNSPDVIIKLLLARIDSEEADTECLTLVYQNLSEILQQRDVNCGLDEECLARIVKVTEGQVWRDICIQLRDAAIRLMSITLAVLLSRTGLADCMGHMEEWVGVVEGWSGAEHSEETRLVVVEGVNKVLPLLHPSVSESVVLRVLEVVVYELQDDSSLVREAAGEAVMRWLSERPPGRTLVASHPSRVLTQLCGVIGSMGTCGSLSLLVTLCLKEDSPQGFGLSQDEDRVFDKGEMNVYSETLLVARTVAASITAALSECPQPPVFLAKSILPYLFAPSDVMESGGGQLNDDAMERASQPVVILNDDAMERASQPVVILNHDQMDSSSVKLSACATMERVPQTSATLHEGTIEARCSQDMIETDPVSSVTMDKDAGALSEEDKYLSISQLATVLEQDIHHAFRQVSSVTCEAAFSVKNLDLWLVRLGCRSALWRSLTRQHHQVHSSHHHRRVGSVLDALRNSVLKVNLIQDIIKDLS